MWMNCARYTYAHTPPLSTALHESQLVWHNLHCYPNLCVLISPLPPSALLSQVIETMPGSPEVAKFMDSIKLDEEEEGGAKEEDEGASSQAPEDER